MDMVWALLHKTQQCSVCVLTSFVCGSKIFILPMTSLNHPPYLLITDIFCVGVKGSSLQPV
jgi:hypothetical protein